MHTPPSSPRIAAPGRDPLLSPTSVDIIFAPVLQVVSTMRRFVLALYERVLHDADVSADMALVTHELLENAIKYNTHADARLRVSVERQGDPATSYVITIRTSNHATREHIHSAERLIGRVRDAADPELMYHQMILSSTQMSEGSGLGLARIRAETRMAIDIDVVGDQIEVIARTLMHVGGAA